MLANWAEFENKSHPKLEHKTYVVARSMASATPSSLAAAALDRVFDTYFELGRPGAVPYLFLDEIQNVDGWERWVRSRTETGRVSRALQVMVDLGIRLQLQ